MLITTSTPVMMVIDHLRARKKLASVIPTWPKHFQISASVYFFREQWKTKPFLQPHSPEQSDQTDESVKKSHKYRYVCSHTEFLSKLSDHFNRG
jgi:hypothetical protein